MSAIEPCITWVAQLHGARAERMQAVWTLICKEVPNFEQLEVSIAKFGTRLVLNNATLVPSESECWVA